MTRQNMFACFRGRRHVGGESNPDESRSMDARTTTVDDDTVEERRRRGGAVVVELFSSQGCATSPEAELVVSRIGKGNSTTTTTDNEAERAPAVIVLSFHVDYWDYTGWKDPFGSSQWTVRQKAYVESFNLDTMFTPQVVIQGKAQCVGNDEEGLLSCIASAPRFPPPSFKATFERTSADSLQVSLSGALLRSKVESNGGGNVGVVVDILVALYENGLVTNCSSGANEGKILPADFVVRGLQKLCSVKDISPKKTLTAGSITFKLWEGFKSIKCGLALFVQNQHHHQIMGAITFKLPDDL
ncbi:uncharacterized protein LOC124944064 [Impatiens glandulifera]|uniref:uncharacterized protein LOC124944064 n=1 Tax=Impatiens glandulifera TaxID=253017 RepID=UPI001FB0DD75|nr:uncharacterized protein LOC124944064 [Impatiens glandulifera]